jgi:predicted nucleotidyltransferase
VTCWFERMKEMTMLGLTAVDLGLLVTALEDQSHWGDWWIDGITGQVGLRLEDAGDDPASDTGAHEDPRIIEPLPSSVGYRDMEDFIALVPSRRVADLLDRAIAGRGAFRRFKDTLVEFPDLRQAWFRFHDTRMRRRAVMFLAAEELIDPAEAERELTALEDPAVGGRPATDAREVARDIARDLRELYGDNLVEVVLCGSLARGDAVPDSGIDLAVVLRELVSPWDELRRMDGILWRHTLESGLTASAAPLSRGGWDEVRRPLVRSAKAEGVRVG